MGRSCPVVIEEWLATGAAVIERKRKQSTGRKTITIKQKPGAAAAVFIKLRAKKFLISK
jgi:hypothetical protein